MADPRWQINHPEQWPFRIARTLGTITMRRWGDQAKGEPQMLAWHLKEGSIVRIVNVYGYTNATVTDHLTGVNGHLAEVPLADLESAEGLDRDPDRGPADVVEFAAARRMR